MGVKSFMKPEQWWAIF